MPERRQFERLQLSEDAIAVDESGPRLGVVTQVGGGGMLVRLEPNAERYRLGQQLRVTVMEPGTKARHTIDVAVRYANAEDLGLEFVTGQSHRTP